MGVAVTPGELTATSTGLAPFIGVGVLLPRDRAKPSRCPMAMSEAGSRLPFSLTVEFLALGGGLWEEEVSGKGAYGFSVQLSSLL